MNAPKEFDESHIQAASYEEVARSLGISLAYVERIHAYYMKRRLTDTTTRTQMVIYDAIAEIRGEDPSFPYKLSRAYVVSSAFAKMGLTEKKKPNPYVSKATGKRILTAGEVVSIIEQRQEALLAQVKDHGMAEGYREFALMVNRELDEAGESLEVPLDWKYLSKKLGDGSGKNLHTGGGFLALRLSERVRYEMTRVLQARPIYPTKVQIQANEAFKLFIESHLRAWQQAGNDGGFHKALKEGIRLWNESEKESEDPFLLPVHLFKSEKQEGLSQILGIQKMRYDSILRALGISLDSWNSNQGYHQWISDREKLIPLLMEYYFFDIDSRDLSVKDGMVRWSARGFERYKGLIDFSKAQEIYDKKIKRRSYDYRRKRKQK